MTAVDDELSIATIYAAEDGLLKLLKQGGTVDFYGSTLDLSGTKVRSWKPNQLPIMQGVVDGLYGAHRGAGVPERPPLLRGSKRAVKASYESGKHEIVLPLQPWAWNDMVLCHEVAHALSPHAKQGNRAGHDHAWRKMYCALVTEVVSPEAGLLLQSFLNL